MTNRSRARARVHTLEITRPATTPSQLDKRGTDYPILPGNVFEMAIEETAPPRQEGSSDLGLELVADFSLNTHHSGSSRRLQVEEKKKAFSPAEKKKRLCRVRGPTDPGLVGQGIRLNWRFQPHHGHQKKDRNMAAVVWPIGQLSRRDSTRMDISYMEQWAGMSSCY